MDAATKNKITQIQIRFLRAIKSHKACYEKLQNGDQSSEISEELQSLKKQMLECHEEQKTLLKEISGVDGMPVYKFDLYKIPADALPKKIRSRKEKIQPMKIEKNNSQEAWRPRTPSPASPSPNESSSSSSCEDSEEEDEVLSQASLPVPLPRPSLLNKNSSLSRHDIRYPKIGRRTRLSVKREEESMMKEIPVYNDPPPSPEPTDEHQAKIKFMAALHLIPIEALAELLSRKTERKRRSTASNQYLYNNDWEVPAVKRKQYLSPVKNKISIQACPPKSDKKKSIAGVSLKSPQHDDGDNTGAKCGVCGACDTMVSCSECCENFHPKCSVIPELQQSFLLCRRCNRARNDTKPVEPLEESEVSDPVKDGETGEEKSKANFFEERLKLRNHLVKVLRCRMIEKRAMERKVLQLSESLALQGRVKMDLLQESKEVGAKVDLLRNFVTLFQMEDGKPRIGNAVTSPRISDDETNLPITPEDLASPPVTPGESASLPMSPEEAASLPLTPDAASPPLTPVPCHDGSTPSSSQDPLLCE